MVALGISASRIRLVAAASPQPSHGRSGSWPRRRRDGPADDPPRQDRAIGQTERLVTAQVVVLGSANVGKSSLLAQFVHGTFTEKRTVTTGADFAAKRLRLGDREVRLAIWDTAGQERFHHGTLGGAFYRGADAALLVYDTTDLRTFEQIEMWRRELLQRVDGPPEEFPVVVVGNKVDLPASSAAENGQNDVARWYVSPRGYFSDESRRRRGRDVDIPRRRVVVDAAALRRGGYSAVTSRRGRRGGRRVVATPWPRSAKTSRCDAAAAFRGDESKRRRDRDVDIPRRRVVATPRPCDVELRPRPVVRLRCRELGIGLCLTSAKDGTGVTVAMEAAAMLALENRRRRGDAKKRLGPTLSLDDAPRHTDGPTCCA